MGHTLIDVGPGAGARPAGDVANYTEISPQNPANATGIIDVIQIYAYQNMSGVRVGTFYLTGGTNYKCRDSVAIGNVTAGATRTFTGLNLAVQAGDVLGAYWTGGQLAVTQTGLPGYYYKSGEYIDPGDSADFTLAANSDISLYGTGADPVVITTVALPDGTVGVAYSETCAATGGAAPYTWSLSAGALPDGLSLGADGVIDGDPTVAGAFAFTVKAVDSLTYENSDTQALTITIAAAAGGGGPSIRSFATPGGAGRGLTWDGRCLWLVDLVNHLIYQIDPATGKSHHSVATPATNPAGLTWDGRKLWNTDLTSGLIYQLDPVTGEVVRSFTAPGQLPRDLAWDGRCLWNTDTGADLIYQINPVTGQVIRSIASPAGDTIGLTWDGRTLWACDNGTLLIYQIDPVTGKVIRSITSPNGDPRGMTWDGRTLWLVDEDADLLYQIAV